MIFILLVLMPTCSSSELSTYLSGRYVEIKVLPLSFREFLDFHGYKLTERKSPAGGVKKRIMDDDGEVYDAKELLMPIHGSAVCLCWQMLVWKSIR